MKLIEYSKQSKWYAEECDTLHSVMKNLWKEKIILVSYAKHGCYTGLSLEFRGVYVKVFQLPLGIHNKTAYQHACQELKEYTDHCNVSLVIE